MRRIKRVLSSLLLLTLFATYQVSITMFTHVHYVNGVMIVHSHPSKGKQHSHTSNSVIVIGQLAAFHSLEAEGCAYATPFWQLLHHIEPQSEIPAVGKKCLRTFSLRAPPAFHSVAC